VLLVWAPLTSLSLVGQEHGRTIPLSAVRCRRNAEEGMNSRRRIWHIQDVVCLAQSTKEHSVQQQHAPIDVVLDALRCAQFDLIDVVRRAQGIALGALGLDPDECPYRIIRSAPCWRLRDYADAGHDPSPALLIVAAPIKRPYIWDLAPSASAIRCCLRQRLHVYLLEWMPASHTIRKIADLMGA
jgi:hypothetical protein